jgi:hypothetical protein
MIINNFNVWDLGVPVAGAGTNLDFTIWYLNAPMLVIDESYVKPRRRAFIF